MPHRQQRFASLALTVALVAANLVAVNFLISGWSTARLDLTEEGVFSISPATKRILTSLDEDLTIYGYFSKRTHPKLSPLVPEIEDLLDEYRAVARGRVHIEIFDPAENEEAGQEAADRYGVRSTPFRLASKYESGIVNAYFAIVIKYGDQYERYGFTDLIKVDPLPDGDIDVKLRNLEYDLTRAIKKVVFGFRSTNELFARIDQPVTLTAVISEDSLPEVFSEVPAAVRKAAEELAEIGGDKFIFEDLDPVSDPQAKAEVESRYGIAPMSLGLFSQESFYLYGLLDIGGQLEQLPLSGGDTTAASVREAVENALRRNTPGFLKTVGIVAPSPMQLPPQLQMQMRQPPPEFEEVKRFLGQDYQVKEVSLEEAGGVPTDVDLLLVLKPTDLDDTAVFNLDQYMMRGGRVVLCASNYHADFGQGGLSVRPLNTGLDDWLAHHGVTLDSTLVLDDQNQALPIPELRNTPLGTMRTWRMAPYPYLVQVREDGFVNPDITVSLDAVGIYWGSPISIDSETTGDLEVLEILKSSARSWTSDDTSQVGFVDYEVPEEGTEPQLLAVALNGKFESYFAEREVPSPEDHALEDDHDHNAEGAAAPSVPAVALKESPETRLVIVGNAAFLSDFVARTIGQMDGSFFIENLRFMQNVMDWASLDNDMLGIRSRGLVSRRLDRTTKSSQVTIESINYLIPAVLLLALGINMRMRRQRTSSVLTDDVVPAPPSMQSRKEA